MEARGRAEPLCREEAVRAGCAAAAGGSGAAASPILGSHVHQAGNHSGLSKLSGPNYCGSIQLKT